MKTKYSISYLLSIIIISIIAFTITIICLNLIDSLLFSLPMTWLALQIFGNPILDYIKKYK